MNKRAISFLEKAKKIHNNKYDYSLVEYKNNKTKVKIICPLHGEFEQRPDNHLGQKQGCPKCGRNIVSKKLSKGKEKFIEEAKKIHDDEYDYSSVDYKSNFDLIKIICPVHGEFEQTPHNHLKGYKCKKCSIEKNALERMVTREEFIEKAKKIHGDEYNYSLVDYKGSFKYITINCPIHGEWNTLAYIHLQGCGCPSCRKSKAEEEVASFIKEIESDVQTNVRNIIPPYELDIYLPTKKFAIEFNGLYWHTEKKGKGQNYHLNKTVMCEKKGITLIQIFENEWEHKKDLIKSIIKSKLGLIKNKIGARKTEVKFIEDAKEFLDKNHLQGSISGKIKIGLYFKNELVSVLLVDKPRFNKNYDFEILRFCNKIDSYVIGGFAKMLNFFKKEFNNPSIITYSDKRYFNGNIYITNGFKYIKDSKPNYYYFKDNKIYSRMKFQKHKLEKILNNFDPNLTESDNMQLNGYDRIWDCGNKIFEVIK